MIKKIISTLVLLILTAQSANAISERHLIIIRHGEAEHNVRNVYNSNPNHPNYKPASLTTQGKLQAKQTAERLVLHGFDNRNINAVFVSPLPRTIETAQVMAEYGVFAKDKIKIEPRLIEAQSGDLEDEAQNKYTIDSWHISDADHKKFRAETNSQVRKRVLNLYDEIEKKYPDGHIVFVTHGMPAMELLQDIVQIEVKLNTAEAYLVPLIARG